MVVMAKFRTNTLKCKLFVYLHLSCMCVNLLHSEAGSLMTEAVAH